MTAPPHSRAPTVQPVMQPATAEVYRHLLQVQLITTAALACLRHRGDAAERVQDALHEVDAAQAALARMDGEDDT